MASTRWTEAVLCYTFGFYKAAIAMASSCCETKLKFDLRPITGGPKNYSDLITKAQGDTRFSAELLKMHRRTASDYRNPYVHSDVAGLLRKRKLSGKLMGPGPNGHWTEITPSDWFASMMMILQEDRPKDSALECLQLALKIIDQRVVNV